MPVAERRAQLIAAASRVISREGVAGATTRRIAEEAGAPLAMLHYSFRNKEDLFAAVIDYGIERTYELIAQRAVPAGSGVAGAVAGYLETYREWAGADPNFMVAQYALLTWMLRSPDGRRDIARAYQHYIEGLVPVLAAAASEHDHGVDLHKLARLAVAAADGTILQLVTIGPAAFDGIATADIADGLVHTARTVVKS
ncbi:MAG TPA: TetR/AcrR family transcriptional regulator [Pseudonocardia sp.]|jgi:AcrR family transcriptional regulator